jgi:hypothetical protein
VAADALATHALAAASSPDADTQARGLAAVGELAARVGPPLPRPRFVTVLGQVFVRRGSCCLIYMAADAQMCTSCPKRDPAERVALLSALVRRGSKVRERNLRGGPDQRPR